MSEVVRGVFSFLFQSRKLEKKNQLGNLGHPIVAQSGSETIKLGLFESGHFFLGLTRLILFRFYFIQSSGTRRRRGEAKAQNIDNSSSAASWA